MIPCNYLEYDNTTRLVCTGYWKSEDSSIIKYWFDKIKEIFILIKLYRNTYMFKKWMFYGIQLYNGWIQKNIIKDF